LPAPQSIQKLDFQTHGQLAWEALESLINSAQTQLDLCTYVLGNDSLGKRVAGLLEERAAAGVRVRLLLDAVGSWRTSSRQLRDLRAAGIEVHWSMPVLFNLLRGRGNLRNHRKLVIADSQRFWSGGRNLAAEYFSGQAQQRPWTDLSFSIDGPLAQQAQALFNRHWRYSLGLTATGDDKEKQSPAVQPSAPADSTRQHYAQLVPSGPDQAEDTVYGLLLTTIFRAEQRVLAVTPYFVPDDSLLTALCLAARRGVRVELVLPARSNHRLADIARARALRDLVAAGAHVRLATGMVHAKALVVDQALALCGSVNLDSRSLFLNFELMVAFYSNQDIAIVAQWMDENFNQASDFHPVQPSLLRDIAEGLVRWLGFQI
jgi:cardiolipin synthase